MSLTKRIWFDRDPAYDELRKRRAQEAWAYREQFTFRIATRRKSKIGARHWDPFWTSCLLQAANELGIETVNVNNGMFLRTKSDQELVKARAEAIWIESHSSHAARIQQSLKGKS